MSKSALQLTDATGCVIAPLARQPLSPEAATELTVKLKALSDPVRLRLLSVVASHVGGEACVCDLSAGIDLTQPTISHHLKILRTAGLLTANGVAPGSITASSQMRSNSFRYCWTPVPS